MKIYQYRHQVWLYKQDNLWKRIKRELPKILICMAFGTGLVLIAILTER